MKKIDNMKITECPECGSLASVKKRGLLAKIGIGGGLLVSLTGSALAMVGFLSFFTFGLITLGSLIMPMLIVFTLIFLPIYEILNYVTGYDVVCEKCGSKYHLSTKEFYEIKGKNDPIVRVIIIVIFCIVIISA